jgi:hypothetical protein
VKILLETIYHIRWALGFSEYKEDVGQLGKLIGLVNAFKIRTYGSIG